MENESSTPRHKHARNGFALTLGLVMKIPRLERNTGTQESMNAFVLGLAFFHFPLSQSMPIAIPNNSAKIARSSKRT
jgi:hypothetical protein